MFPSIPSELAEFLESGISVLVGSHDARLVPEAVRAMGARIEGSGRELTVFLPVATAGPSLANLRENGRVAVCFTAVDHRSYQIKGAMLDVRPADERDRSAIERYKAAFTQHFGAIGVPPAIARRIAHWPAHAVRLRVEGVFIQTPGPGAGVPLDRPAGGAKP